LKNFIFIFCSLFLFSCNQRNFPELKHLKNSPETIFLASADHQGIAEKNWVYSPTLLFAWEELQKEIGKINTDPKDSSLTIFNQSVGFQGCMTKDEYKTSVERNGLEIIAKAEFNKSLGFEKSFEIFNSFNFNNKDVKGFGISSNHSLKNQLNILYYENKENMLIQLIPQEKEHEILLFRTTEPIKSPKEMLQLLEQKIEKGILEMKNDSLLWKYSFQEADLFIVPMISFHFDNDYEEFLDKFIVADKKEYKIIKAWQRTAFLLDEQGAKVESESEVGVKESAAIHSENQPKKLMFDGPFWVIMRHTNGFQGKSNIHPYFIAYIQNPSIMQVAK